MHSRRLCAFWMERFTEFCRKQPELRVSFRVNISLSKCGSCQSHRSFRRNSRDSVAQSGFCCCQPCRLRLSHVELGGLKTLTTYW